MFRGERAKAVLIRSLEVVVIAIFVALLWDNYQLRAIERQTRVSSSPQRAFSVGEQFRRVPVTDANGVERELSFMSRRTVVAILNPSCSTCERTLGELRASSAEIIVLGRADTDGLPALAARYGLGPRAFTIGTSATPPFLDRVAAGSQLFVVENGTVVRTCQSVKECDGQ